MTKKAFITVEVLISLVIVSMGVLTVTSASKTMYASVEKKTAIESMSTTILTLKDYIKSINFEQKQNLEGTLNNWTYTISPEKIATDRNYVYHEENDENIKNKGSFEITLYKIILTISNGKQEKKISFYETRYKKLFGDADEF